MPIAGAVLKPGAAVTAVEEEAVGTGRAEDRPLVRGDPVLAAVRGSEGAVDEPGDPANDSLDHPLGEARGDVGGVAIR